MAKINQNLQKEIMQLLQRKRRYGKSLTNKEAGSFEKSMSSEDLLSSSACLALRFLLKGKNCLYVKKSTSEKMNEVKR